MENKPEKSEPKWSEQDIRDVCAHVVLHHYKERGETISIEQFESLVSGVCRLHGVEWEPGK